MTGQDKLFQLESSGAQEPELFEVPGSELPVKVFRNALDNEDIELLLGLAYAMIDEASASRALNDRGFYRSTIMPASAEDLSPNVLDIIGNKNYTARVNVQGPGKAQGWHRDYRPEAAVLYPEGEGAIDINHIADSLSEVRRGVGSNEVLSIPVHPGDLAIISCGQEVFHRGRNTGQSVRRTVVLHDVPEGQYPVTGF